MLSRTTATVAEGPDDQLVFRQKPDKSSAGAEKLSQKFITHARLEVRKKRLVEMKLNVNELCHNLPDDKEFEDDEEYKYNDEEGHMGEDED